jgi:hypothetical protein
MSTSATTSATAKPEGFNIKMYNNKHHIIYIVIFIIVISIFVVLSTYLQKNNNNCNGLEKILGPSISPIENSANKPLSKYYIKTAYNCCCNGDFINDYVNLCALKNCAKQGFRALDFQIFSINGKAVVSESTVSNSSSQMYKQMYNQINFKDVVNYINAVFFDMTKCPNPDDPLFLIFRFNIDNNIIYNQIYNTLNTIFGTASSSNKIFIPKSNTLDNTSLYSLCKKIIIIVETTNLNNFENSKLVNITSLQLGKSINNQIIRESEMVSSILSGSNNYFQNNLNILYPDYNNTTSINYDYVTTGINTGIQFIGMNAQTNDTYLVNYNKYFTKAFMPITISN